MKKLFIFTCLFLTVLVLYARGIREDIDLAEQKALESYAIGLIMGSNLSGANLDIDYSAFTEGLRASMEKAEAKISENEAMEIIDAAFSRAFEREAEEQRLIQEEFLSNNSIKPGVEVTQSGLQFEIITEGTGERKPEPNSVVKVIYTGTLIDGTQFDNSDEEGAYIPLEMVIPGWTEGLQLMNVGSKYIFYIPATLAYGKNGVQGIIPQYATLIFDVELLEILDGEDFFTQEEVEFDF